METAANKNDLISVLRKWASSLTITALNLVLPLAFEILTEFEDWSPRLEVALILWRCVFPFLIVILIFDNLMIFIFKVYLHLEAQETSLSCRSVLLKLASVAVLVITLYATADSKTQVNKIL